MADSLSREEIVSRIHEVMLTDATVSSEADFMMTHMPFKRLVNFKPNYEISGMDQHRGSYIIDEDDYKDVPTFDEKFVLEEFIKDPKLHKFYMILGKNGSGKSHLIRWLFYQYRKLNEENIITNEETIFIPRAHNNLKDALRQILAVGILPQDRIDYYNKKIGGEASSASGDELKALIYANFKILVEYHKAESGLGAADRARVVEFLNDEVVQQIYFFAKGGPIDRIYNSLTKNSEDMTDGDPFVELDFVKTQEERKKNLFSQSHKARPGVIKVANDLATNTTYRQKVLRFFNSHVGKINERTASINGSDITGIFEEIRKELKKYNKNLTLFIEDINAYKGIDSALVEVLIQEHKDDNGLCRLKSVVGSTDAYFDSFNDALKDRMSKKIVILEKNLLEDRSKLVEFAARYINAVHFSKEEVENWYRNNLEPLTWTSEYKFSNIEVDGQLMSIFPFNENAISNLFECLFSIYKSPRGFLKYVIKEVELGWYKNQEEIVNSKHYLLGNEGIDSIQGFLTEDDTLQFRAQKYPDEEKREIVYTIWGNRTLKPDVNGNVAGVVPEILSLFKLDQEEPIPQIPDDNPQDPSYQMGGGTEPGPVIVVDPNDDKRKKKIKKIYDWADNIEAVFDYHKEARECLGKFILKNINWEMEGIPYVMASDLLSRLQNIYIEGQTVSSNGIVKVKRCKESAEMLIAIISQKDEKAKTWNFKNGPERQIFAKTWLLLNKDEIISNIKNELFVNQDLELLAVEARLCELLAYGRIQDWSDKELLEKIVGERILKTTMKSPKDGQKWVNLQKKIEVNQETINDLFDLYFLNTVGTTKPKENEVKYFSIDSIRLLEKISEAKSNFEKLNKPVVVQTLDERVKRLSDVISFFMEHIDECVTDEQAFAFRQKTIYTGWLGSDLSTVVIQNTIKGMRDYLRFIKNEINLNYPGDLLENLSESSAKDILDDFAIMNQLTKDNELLTKIALAGRIDNSRIKLVSKEFQDFETYLRSRNKLFESKVDNAIQRKISAIKEKITSQIDTILGGGQ